LQYNSLENCLEKHETGPEGIKCVVRGEGRVSSTDGKERPDAWVHTGMLICPSLFTGALMVEYIIQYE